MKNLPIFGIDLKLTASDTIYADELTDYIGEQLAKVGKVYEHAVDPAYETGDGLVGVDVVFYVEDIVAAMQVMDEFVISDGDSLKQVNEDLWNNTIPSDVQYTIAAPRTSAPIPLGFVLDLMAYTTTRATHSQGELTTAAGRIHQLEQQVQVLTQTNNTINQALNTLIIKLSDAGVIHLTEPEKPVKKKPSVGGKPTLH